ncbi:MAG: zinc ribbon domain-containing protein [Coriobacteriales bacterium]|nr:zinc ribbon domain-containing protein [Coriobacteriales bacterium]
MLKCPKCHQHVPDDAAFCNHCGQALNDSAPENAPDKRMAVLGVTVGLLAVVAAALVVLILIKNQTQASAPAQASTSASSSTPTTVSPDQDQAETPDKQEEPAQAEGQQQGQEKSAQDELEERIQAAYTQNPTTIVVGETSTVTGTVRGKYTDIGSEEVVMAWWYWLELPEPIGVVSYGHERQEPIIDLGASYDGNTRVDDWHDYLDKTITLRSKWAGAAQGSTSTATAFLKDSQILEVFE